MQKSGIVSCLQGLSRIPLEHIIDHLLGAELYNAKHFFKNPLVTFSDADIFLYWQISTCKHGTAPFFFSLSVSVAQHIERTNSVTICLHCNPNDFSEASLLVNQLEANAFGC